jgi:hypothetical protein
MRATTPAADCARNAFPTSPVVEWTLAFAILTAAAAGAWRFLRSGYLPQPFYFRVNDSLMDFYTPAFWAHNIGVYEKWHAIYPPLSFVLLKLVTPGVCYQTTNVAGRNCDSWAGLGLVMVLTLNAGLTYLAYRRVAPRSAVPRTIAVSIGLQMLYALERGNLLIVAFTGLILAYGPLLRRPALRWFAMALAINFKPYVVILSLAFLARRRWFWLFGCGASAIAIYLVSWLIMGEGSPVQLLTQETHYAQIVGDRFFSNVYYATSFWPWVRLLAAAPPGMVLVSLPAARLIGALLVALMRLAQFAAVICAILALVRPRRVHLNIFGAGCIALSLTTFTTGSAGYTQVFLFFLLFLEPWRGAARITLLACTYLLCIPVDYVFWPVVHETAHSWLSGRMVSASFGLSVGQIVRPALLMVIQYTLIWLTLKDLLSRGPPRGCDEPGWSTGERAHSVAAAPPSR